VQAGDVVEAAEDRAARPGGKKRRARWLVARIAAAGTDSSHGSAGGSRKVPGQRGATEHHRDRLAPEQPHCRAIAESREGHRRACLGGRRARSANDRMTGRCLPFGAAACRRAGRADDGDHENRNSARCGFPSAPSAHPEVSQLRGAGPFYCRPSTRASMGGSPMVLRCCLRLYEAVTGPAAVFHLKLVPDVPPISPATQNWLVVPDLGAAAL